jgi:hypothetical protein
LIRKALLEKSVEEYNKYHGAEARVSVLRQFVNARGHVLVQFKGPFCFTCAPDEYYVDFQLLLEELTGFKFEIGSIKQGADGVIVDFKYDKSRPALAYFLRL